MIVRHHSDSNTSEQWFSSGRLACHTPFSNVGGCYLIGVDTVVVMW